MSRGILRPFSHLGHINKLSQLVPCNISSWSWTCVTRVGIIYSGEFLWLVIGHVVPQGSSYCAARYPRIQKFHVQDISWTKIPHSKLSPSDNIDTGLVTNKSFRVLNWSSAHMREIHPFHWFKPSAVLLLRSLPLGSTNCEMGVPVWQKDFRKRCQVLKMDTQAILLGSFQT